MRELEHAILIQIRAAQSPPQPVCCRAKHPDVLAPRVLAAAVHAAAVIARFAMHPRRLESRVASTSSADVLTHVGAPRRAGRAAIRLVRTVGSKRLALTPHRRAVQPSIAPRITSRQHAVWLREHARYEITRSRAVQTRERLQASRNHPCAPPTRMSGPAGSTLLHHTHRSVLAEPRTRASDLHRDRRLVPAKAVHLTSHRAHAACSAVRAVVPQQTRSALHLYLGIAGTCGGSITTGSRSTNAASTRDGLRWRRPATGSGPRTRTGLSISSKP